MPCGCMKKNRPVQSTARPQARPLQNSTMVTRIQARRAKQLVQQPKQPQQPQQQPQQPLQQPLKLRSTPAVSPVKKVAAKKGALYAELKQRFPKIGGLPKIPDNATPAQYASFVKMYKAAQVSRAGCKSCG